jgi:hypothetical protein
LITDGLGVPDPESVEIDRILWCAVDSGDDEGAEVITFACFVRSDGRMQEFQTRIGTLFLLYRGQAGEKAFAECIQIAALKDELAALVAGEHDALCFEREPSMRYPAPFDWLSQTLCKTFFEPLGLLRLELEDACVLTHKLTVTVLVVTVNGNKRVVRMKSENENSVTTS